MAVARNATSTTDTDGCPPHKQLSNILIAEDEPILAKGLVRHVKQLGYDVIGPAADGQCAIDLAKQFKPDLALLDICMPVLDGLSAAAALFDQMQIPVVLVSAHSDEQSVAAGQRVGVFGYLVKPVTIDQLRVNIGVAWARYNRQASLKSEVQDLKTALEERKLIERAKGLLMDRKGMGENEAMQRLKKQARNSRQRLADVARILVQGEALFEEI